MAAPKGNRNACKTKYWEHILKKTLEEYECPERRVEKGQALACIARKCIEQAIDGDMYARTEIANRLDGKPKEFHHITGEFEHRLAAELSEEELERIAAGGSSGAAETTSGETGSPAVH